nr:MAG: putative coat protein P3 [Sobemovirus sp.]
MAKNRNSRAKNLAVVEKVVMPMISQRLQRRPRRGKPATSNPTSGLKVSRQVKAPATAGLVLGRSVPYLRSADEVAHVSNVETILQLTVGAASVSAVVQMAPFALGSWLNGLAVNWSKWRLRKLRFFYIPTCPTSTPGSIHMGLQYDSMDSAPTNVNAISATYRYTSGPVWSGFQAASVLSHPERAPPPEAICCEVDVTRLTLPWYPYVTQTNFTQQGLVAISTQNSYAPGRLVLVMADGPTTSVAAGRLYAQYSIELIEPVASSQNF